ncbi:hypothetical protein ACI2KR_09055 [Pseudomonas luteola]
MSTQIKITNDFVEEYFRTKEALEDMAARFKEEACAILPYWVENALSHRDDDDDLVEDGYYDLSNKKFAGFSILEKGVQVCLQQYIGRGGYDDFDYYIPFHVLTSDDPVKLIDEIKAKNKAALDAKNEQKRIEQAQLDKLQEEKEEAEALAQFLKLKARFER